MANNLLSIITSIEPEFENLSKKNYDFLNKNNNNNINTNNDPKNSNIITPIIARTHKFIGNISNLL
jgi:hypothetical protein